MQKLYASEASENLPGAEPGKQKALLLFVNCYEGQQGCFPEKRYGRGEGEKRLSVRAGSGGKSDYLPRRVLKSA